MDPSSWLNVTDVLATVRRPGLERWMAATASRLARSLPASTDAELTGLVLRELDEISAPARNAGIRLHALVSGSEAVSGPLTADEKACLGAWEELVEREGLEVVESEVRLCDPAWGYKGRCDLVVRRNGYRVVVEVKTGKKVPEDVALQCAAYARAPYRRDADNVLLGSWSVHSAAVIHLRPDGAEWLPVPVGPREWEAFRGALALARYANNG